MRQYNMKIFQVLGAFNRGWNKCPSPGSNTRFEKTKSQIFQSPFSVQNEHKEIRIYHMILSDSQFFSGSSQRFNA